MSHSSASAPLQPSLLEGERAPRRRRVRALAVAALAVGLAYVVWRATSTLDLAVWWISLPLLALELHALAGLGLYTFSLWDLDSVPPAGVEEDTAATVAVLIPTYNEPEEVLLPTVAAAVALQPSHSTWVLDDGNRPEVRALAEALGAGYLSRSHPTDAKAGNLNHALEHIDADLVAVLDADHVASEGFLRRTLGYFRDPEVAVVQTPQDFYNGGSFEHIEARTRGLDRQDRTVYSEQSLFYRAIQPGKNRWKAAFWCGTGAVLRVAALRSVGGVATGSVTEDIQTTIRLQRRGWRVIYHNEVLARGLAATTVEQYALQRHRWCTGAMQVLRNERPLRGPGLTCTQRLAYAATLLGWFDAWRTLSYQLLPLAVVLTGASPIRSAAHQFLLFFTATFLLQQLALWRLGRGYSRPLPVLIFELVRMAPTLRATMTLLHGGARPFRVTPKGRTDQRRGRAPAPRLLAALLASAVLCAGWYLATVAGLTPTSYATPWVVHGAFLWLVANASLTAAAIRRVRAQRYAGERRASVRFEVQQHAELDGAACLLIDVSLTGARVVLPTAEAPSATAEVVELLLPLPSVASPLPCTVRERRLLPSGDVELGLHIVGATTQQRARLALWAFGVATAELAPALLAGTPKQRRASALRRDGAPAAAALSVIEGDAA